MITALIFGYQAEIESIYTSFYNTMVITGRIYAQEAISKMAANIGGHVEIYLETTGQKGVGILQELRVVSRTSVDFVLLQVDLDD